MKKTSARSDFATNGEPNHKEIKRTQFELPVRTRRMGEFELSDLKMSNLTLAFVKKSWANS